MQKSATFSTPMKRSLKPRFILLLLIVIAATCGSTNRVWIGFGSNHRNGNLKTRFGGYRFDDNNVPLDYPLFNSTLLKLAEIDLGEGKLMKETERLLNGYLDSPNRRHVA